jgi:filamentous hemagglutinin
MRGGWIDMVHFLFYAGEARKLKNSGVKNPIEIAVDKGYQQELLDQFIAKHSAFSYEDLPSDNFGAIFGANVFDSNSEKTLGEQIQNYLINELGANKPDYASNWDNLPDRDNKDPPIQNKTTFPLYLPYIAQ